MELAVGLLQVSHDHTGGDERGGGGPWKTLEVRAWMAKLSIKQHYVMTQGLIRIE